MQQPPAIALAPAKPLLRGWSHLVSFPVWVVVGVTTILLVNIPPSGRVLLAIYVGGTGVMFGVSAMYHRGRWQPPAQALMQKLDRSAIFLAIAGGYTPVAVVCLNGGLRVVMLSLAWGGAAIGIAIQWLPSVPKAWRGASYIIVSWTALFVFPQLSAGLGPLGFWLIVAGGACYTVGALSLATRWPNPWPRVFGFHEVFHAFTVVAAALQFVAICHAVVPRL
ncbi:MAG: hemolysin III family protein [Actinomycetota bacterium]|nr:hemolysin III family protein [Actinomycetota bacterium]